MVGDMGYHFPHVFGNEAIICYLRSDSVVRWLPWIIGNIGLSAAQGILRIKASRKAGFVNWEFIMKYLPLYQKAAWLTVRIGLCGVALSVLIGLMCALVQHYRVPLLRQLTACYIELSRNTPLLIQLFFIYYGLPKLGIKTDAPSCGMAGLAFLGGGYMAEAFRSGIEAVDKAQMESAYSLGLDRWQTFFYVLLPQAVSISFPAFVANVIFLLKETSVFSAISLMDLMFTAKDLIGLYYQTVESLFLLVVFYLLILLPVSLAGTLLERRIRYAGFGV